MLRTLTPQRSSRRGGFTLIEILVVITIIAVLIGLLLAAMGPIRRRGDEAKLRADLSGLDAALGQFKAKFGRNVPCSGQGAPANGTTILNGTFRLCSAYQVRDMMGNITFAPGFNTNSPEIVALKAMWPRMNLLDNGLRKNAVAVAADADMNGESDNLQTDGLLPSNPLLLDPNQCLVFFLSGGVNMEFLGFSTSPTQPFAATATSPNGQRIPAFFDFKTDRLKAPSVWLGAEHGSDIAALSPAPAGFTPTAPIRWTGGTDTLTTVGVEEKWYLDPWKTPYLYMSTSGIGSVSDYPFKDTVACSELVIGPWGGAVSNFNASTAPAKMGPTAFRESANKWVNNTGYQLLSGGPNGADVGATPWGFGPGGQVTFGKSAGYTTKDAGGDDYSNFRSGALSVTD